MPGLTPNFSIPYPCAGETIDPTVFQDFADAVEAALTTVDAANVDVLQRPRAAMNNGAGTSVAVNVATAMVFSTFEFSSDVTAAAGGFTITESGIYMLGAQFRMTTSATTITSAAGQALKGATVQYRRKIVDNPASNPALDINIMGLITASPADVISFQYHWTGTGGPEDITCRATIAKLVNL